MTILVIACWQPSARRYPAHHLLHECISKNDLQATDEGRTLVKRTETHVDANRRQAAEKYGGHLHWNNEPNRLVPSHHSNPHYPSAHPTTMQLHVPL
ncbi:MAG: hypothetical protein Q9206_005284 [Seirophora lacunosa]